MANREEIKSEKQKFKWYHFCGFLLTALIIVLYNLSPIMYRNFPSIHNIASSLPYTDAELPVKKELPITENCSMECLFSLEKCCPHILDSFPPDKAKSSWGLNYTVLESYYKPENKRKRCEKVADDQNLWYQPRCVYKKLTSDSVKQCIEKRIKRGNSTRFIFIGGARMRNKFAAFLNLVSDLDIHLDDYETQKWSLVSYLSMEDSHEGHLRGRSRVHDKFQAEFYWFEIRFGGKLKNLIASLGEHSKNKPAFVLMGLDNWLHYETFKEDMRPFTSLLSGKSRSYPVIFQMFDPLYIKGVNVLIKTFNDTNNVIKETFADTNVVLWDTTWVVMFAYMKKCREMIRKNGVDVIDERWWCLSTTQTAYYAEEQYAQMLYMYLCHKK